MLHFKSKSWGLDFLKAEKNAITMQGFAEFFVLSDTKAYVSIYQNSQPILDKLLNIEPLLDDAQLDYVARLKNLLAENRIEGILEFFDEDGKNSEFLAISVYLPIETWQELRSKINSPVPTCLLSANLGISWEGSKPNPKRPLPLNNTSLTLKYE